LFSRKGRGFHLLSESAQKIKPSSKKNATCFSSSLRPEWCARHLLSAERATLSETGLATSGLAKDGRAASADDNGLGVREDGGDGEATGALDVHEEGTGSRHKGLKLVLASLSLRSGVEEVDRENHLDEKKCRSAK